MDKGHCCTFNIYCDICFTIHFNGLTDRYKIYIFCAFESTYQELISHYNTVQVKIVVIWNVTRLSKFISFGCCCNIFAAVPVSVSLGTNFGSIKLSPILYWFWQRQSLLLILIVINGMPTHAIFNLISIYSEWPYILNFLSHFCSSFLRLTILIN